MVFQKKNKEYINAGLVNKGDSIVIFHEDGSVTALKAPDRAIFNLPSDTIACVVNGVTVVNLDPQYEIMANMYWSNFEEI